MTPTTMPRVLSLAELRTLCTKESDTTYRYWIDKVSRSRVHIGCMARDAYGFEGKAYAVLPCYPYAGTTQRIVLDPMRVDGDAIADPGLRRLLGTVTP